FRAKRQSRGHPQRGRRAGRRPRRAHPLHPRRVARDPLRARAVTASPFEPWHDFFVVAGTAGVTLLGLLFVAVSLNTGIIMRSDERRLRVQAVTSFEALLFTAVLSLIALSPVESARQHAVMLIGFGAVWFLRSLTHLRSLAGAGVALRRRLLLPAAA